MKKYLKPAILPWFALAAGGVGAALRFWLLSSAGDSHLLPAGHPAHILVVILSVIVLAILLIGTRPLVQAHKYSFNFPASPVGAIGVLLGAVGIGITSIGDLASGADAFTNFTAWCGLVCVPCLFFVAYCRWKGHHPSLLFHTVTCLYLMIRLVCLYRSWSSDPQLEDFLFSLLATVFLLLSCYHRTAFDANFGSRRSYTFFSLACLYFCCLALPGCDQVFFCIGAGCWMATNACSLLPITPQQSAAPEEA